MSNIQPNLHNVLVHAAPVVGTPTIDLLTIDLSLLGQTQKVAQRISDYYVKTAFKKYCPCAWYPYAFDSPGSYMVKLCTQFGYSAFKLTVSLFNDILDQDPEVERLYTDIGKGVPKILLGQFGRDITRIITNN